MLKFLCTFALVMKPYYFVLGREYANDVFASIELHGNRIGLERFTSEEKPDVTEYFGKQTSVGSKPINVTEVKLGFFDGVKTIYHGPYFNNKFQQQSKTCPYKQQQNNIKTIEDDIIIENEQ